MTETSRVTHFNPVYGTRKVGSIGVPLLNTDVKVVALNDPDQEMSVGKILRRVLAEEERAKFSLNYRKAC